MYDNTVHRDYVKTEMNYRLARIQSDIVGRRKRRTITMTRRWGAGADTSTWAS